MAGISDVPFVSQGDPFTQLQKVLKELDGVVLDAEFVDQQGKLKIDRNYIEMVISQYARSTQNPTVFNKWLQIDTKLDKSLKEYKSDLQIMLAGLSSMDTAKSIADAPIDQISSMPNNPGAAPNMPGTQTGGSGIQMPNKLPTTQKTGGQ